MKQKTKAYLAFGFLGGILLTSTILFALPPPSPTMTESEMISETEITKTGSPMDNYPDEQRDTFCGTGDAKSNTFVTEYKIPTVCTQPLAIQVTPDGQVWFVESNVGRIANFDPTTETFTEYDNPYWPEASRSMNWGIDYSPDNSLWYTDGSTDSIWQFSINDKNYTALTYPVSESGSLPQRLEIYGSNVFVNDFTGGKLTMFDISHNSDAVEYTSVVNPIPESFTGDFALDSQDNVWYTSWRPDDVGVLAKVNISMYTEEFEQDETLSENDVEAFEFPQDLNTANGLSVDSNGDIWIVDTSSSFFFKFEPTTEEFTKYITHVPHLSTYGNETGVIKDPISRPYWTDLDNFGNLVFNEQTSNRIGILNISTESFTEYMIPSKNPNWGDCGDLQDCGIAQVFDFAIHDKKIWFTEWVENNIGVLDTEKPLPFTVETDTREITLKKGESIDVVLNVNYSDVGSYVNSEFLSAHTAARTINFTDIEITSSRESLQNNKESILVTINASKNALSGDYKVLLGIGNDEITVSKFINVKIES